MLTTNTPSTIDPNFTFYIFRLESHEVNYCHPSSDKLKPRAGKTSGVPGPGQSCESVLAVTRSEFCDVSCDVTLASNTHASGYLMSVPQCTSPMVKSGPSRYTRATCAYSFSFLLIGVFEFGTRRFEVFSSIELA
jgi:hypothetical protein